MRTSAVVSLFAAACVALSQPAAAAPELMRPREPGDLAVMVAAAYNPDYIREWVTTKFEESPTLTRVHETTRGRWLFVSFLVTGLTPTAELAHDFEVGFRLLRPDGSVLFDEPSHGRNRFKGAARRGFVMSDPALDLLFDETDPIGKYTLEVTVRDKIAGTKARATYEIHLRTT